MKYYVEVKGYVYEVTVEELDEELVSIYVAPYEIEEVTLETVQDEQP